MHHATVLVDKSAFQNVHFKMCISVSGLNTEMEMLSFWWNFHHLAASKVVIWTTVGAASDENFINMMTFLFQFKFVGNVLYIVCCNLWYSEAGHSRPWFWLFLPIVSGLSTGRVDVLITHIFLSAVEWHLSIFLVNLIQNTSGLIRRHLHDLYIWRCQMEFVGCI